MKGKLFFVMKEDDPSKADDEKSAGLTVYKPEDPVFQKRHLCEYLRELYDTVEDDNDLLIKKRKE